MATMHNPYLVSTARLLTTYAPTQQQRQTQRPTPEFLFFRAATIEKPTFVTSSTCKTLLSAHVGVAQWHMLLYSNEQNHGVNGKIYAAFHQDNLGNFGLVIQNSATQGKSDLYVCFSHMMSESLESFVKTKKWTATPNIQLPYLLELAISKKLRTYQISKEITTLTVNDIAKECYARWGDDQYTNKYSTVLDKTLFTVFEGKYPFVLTVFPVEQAQAFVNISFLSSLDPMDFLRNISAQGISEEFADYYYIPEMTYENLLTCAASQSSTQKSATNQDTQESDATYWKLKPDTDDGFWHRCAKRFITQWQHNDTKDFDSLVHALTSRVFHVKYDKTMTEISYTHTEDQHIFLPDSQHCHVIFILNDGAAQIFACVPTDLEKPDDCEDSNKKEALGNGNQVVRAALDVSDPVAHTDDHRRVIGTEV